MKEKINKLLLMLKENKYFLITLLGGMIFLIFFMSNVLMYADDFGLKSIADNGIKNMIEYQISHFKNWGGGFTPILATSFLRLNFNIWKLFISSIITISIALIIKIIPVNKDSTRGLIALLFWALFFMISIEVSSQTIYWLDGSMSYVFTVFQFILYLYFLITRICYNKRKKYDIVVYPIVSFFAGWSSAQTGALVLIIPVCLVLYSLITKKRKIKIIDYISIVLGIIGFAIFYFAPGNSARMVGNFWVFNGLNIFDKFLYRIDDIMRYIFDFNSVSIRTLPFYILLYISLICAIGRKIATKKDKLFIKICFVFLFLYLITMLYISLKLPGSNYLYTFLLDFHKLYQCNIKIKMIVPYLFNFLCIISLLICTYFVTKETKIYILFYSLFGALISQGVMIMSPYSEYRTVFIGILFLIFSILACLFIIYDKKMSFIEFSFLPLAVLNSNCAIIALLFFIFTKTSERKIKIGSDIDILIIFLLIFAIYNYSISYYRYYKNKIIWNENVEKLKNYENEKTVVLKRPTYNGYGYTNNFEFTKDSIKQIYGINKDTKIVFE